jgi:hypothetical protein
LSIASTLRRIAAKFHDCEQQVVPMAWYPTLAPSRSGATVGFPLRSIICLTHANK